MTTDYFLEHNNIARTSKQHKSTVIKSISLHYFVWYSMVVHRFLVRLWRHRCENRRHGWYENTPKPRIRPYSSTSIGSISVTTSVSAVSADSFLNHCDRNDTSSTFIIASAAAAAAAILLAATTKESERRKQQQPHPHPHLPQEVNTKNSRTTKTNSNSNSPVLLATSTLPVNDDDAVEYDFVIIGYGSAGYGALTAVLHQLQSSSTLVRIAVIDPAFDGSNVKSTMNNSSVQVDMISGRVASVQSNEQTLQIQAASSEYSRIRYQHGIVLATGVHGAVPPSYIFDANALPHVYELKPTVLAAAAAAPNAQKQKTRPIVFHNSASVNTIYKQLHQLHQLHHDMFTTAKRRRKRQNAATNRNTVTPANTTIGVVGCGWDALNVAATLLTKNHSTSNDNNATSTNDIQNAVPNTTNIVMIYGNNGLLTHVVPNYLSSAVMKRCKQYRRTKRRNSMVDSNALENNNTSVAPAATIKFFDRSVIRYVAYAKPSRTNCYVCKSYDYMDTTTVPLDKILIAPETHGNGYGSGIQATLRIPEFLRHHHSAEGGSYSRSCWYQSWSNLIVSSSSANENNHNVISCYNDDGRILVNTEMHAACRNIYAAGSSAKYPNSMTGHATSAGGSPINSFKSGGIAGANVVLYAKLQQQHNQSFFAGTSKYEDDAAIKHIDPIPVFRSDVRSESVASDDTGITKRLVPTALSNIGITALCVGNCDAENLNTHAIWWTNQSAQRRLLQQRLDDDPDDIVSTNTSSVNIASQKSNNGNCTNTKLSDFEKCQLQIEKDRKKRIRKTLKPVYGIGIIYYLDRGGRVQGVMAWGLPFTTVTDYQHDGSDINRDLLRQMKTVIQTNGGYRSLQTEVDHIKMSKYLSEAGKRMVATAYAGESASSTSTDSDAATSRSYNVDSASIDNFPRPLHRYTDSIRTTSMQYNRTVGVVKRNDGNNAHGVLGEDLFVKYTDDSIADPHIPIPPSVIRQRQRQKDSGADTATISVAQKHIQAKYDWAVWDQHEQRWDENEQRARPPKEEALWIRKGDETRNVGQKERVAAAYRKSVFGS